MQTINEWAHNPAVMWGAIALLTMLARTMPPPKECNGQGYIWLHNILQCVATNFDRVKLPNAMPKPSGEPPVK